MELRAIGVIHSPFTRANGTPIQPSVAGNTRGQVDVFPKYALGLKDLEGFERIWLIYWLDRAKPVQLVTSTFLDPNPHGVFATRVPSRPNPIGISPVRLVAARGRRLEVEEVDILDGTPLLDIKPYTPYTDHFPVERSGWVDLAWKRKRDSEKVADDRFFSPVQKTPPLDR